MFLKIVLICVPILNVNSELTLKQAVILSRHNVRTPLSKTLSQVSPKSWPDWGEKPGYLTPKGALLEGYMGVFFYSWLFEKGILPQECPTEENFFVYANTAQRTLASAKSFVKNGFPNCDIKIHHANKSDPVFNPYIHNTSSTFIQEALNKMKEQLNKLHLNNSYNILEDILDYSQSENCLKNGQCDLAADNNTAYLKPGSKPNVIGPLKISKSSVDSFLMENYEGFDSKHVAWGLLKTEEQWQAIMDLSHEYHNIIFNSTIIAKDISKPLIKYLIKIFFKSSPKVVLVMGHDANMYTVLNAMGFKPYILKNQFEMTPVGGKIVFQKWTDGNREFLKVEYVYQCTEKMRKGEKLSLRNPPMFETLALEKCKVDANGLCPWDDFKKLLNSL